jgi:hypothetical protein
MAGAQTVQRTATSVGSKSETYTFSTTGLAGVTATPSVSSFAAAPGSATPWTVTFLRTTAPLNTYTKGFVVWTGDKGHIVKMPVVLRPVAIAVPAEVSSNGGPVDWTIRTGYDGSLGTSVRGLVPATTTAVHLLQDPDQTFVRTDPTGTFKRDVVVPDGAIFRAGIYEDAITPTGTDLDLFVYLGTSRVGVSADGDSNEEVTVRNTTGMTITLSIYVHGFDTQGPAADLTLFEWVVGSSSAGNVTLTAPATAATGATLPVSASFSGLAAATRYLGAVEYATPTGTSRTFVSVKTP